MVRFFNKHSMQKAFTRHIKYSLQRKATVAKCALSLVALFCSLTATAQVGEPRRNICIGVSGGLTMNKIGFDPTIKQNWHMGPTFGITARFTSERYFKAFCALQLELNYAELGWTENVLNSNSQPLPDTYSRNQHYIQLPIMARLAWGREEHGLMGYVLAGPQLGYCFKEKTSQSAFTYNAEGNPDRPNGMFAQYSMPIDKRFDYGITAGLGAELTTKIGHFLIEGRYYYGLSDIYKNSKKDVFGRSNNGAIVAKITYLFDVRK